MIAQQPGVTRREAWDDDGGQRHERADGGARIVSLVPSLTELVFDLGLGDRLVGRTGFCVHPREALRGVPKVGGTKAIDVERVRALAATHLVCNIDENEKPVVERIAGFVPHVIVTHPCRVVDNRGLFALMGKVFAEVGPEAEGQWKRVMRALAAR